MTYNTLREIGVGEGRNSKVYLADEPQLGGRVAIKEIDKASFGDPTEYFREAQAMFQTTHDNVVPIHYACETAACISLAMPFYTNGSLTKRIKDGPLQLSELLRVARGVLSGLAHVHLAGFVHFDIKPSNVLFSDTNIPMVADFGQSQAVSAAGVATAPNKIYCTALPPETLGTGVGTIAADVYQVGLLLYRSANGDPQFRNQIPPDQNTLLDRIAHGKFPDRQSFMPHVPKHLRTLIRKALRPDPAARFQTGTEMADALGRVRLVLDWSVQPLVSGGFRWRASRPGHADIVVEMTEHGVGTWDVRTFTEKVGEPKRAKGKAQNWRSRINSKEARAHLTRVFQRLRG